MKSSRANRWGTVFLIFAAVGFGVTTFVPGTGLAGWSYLRAFFEASLVGALADWFAVTALFRRPAGLPLPHTDLLFRKREQLAQALPQFLGTFLQPDRLQPTLQTLDYAAMVEQQVDPQQVQVLLQAGLDQLLQAPSPSLLRIEQSALTVATSLLHRELSTHQAALIEPVTALIKKSAGWKGFFVSKDNVAEVIDGLLGELLAVRDTPHHPLRASLISVIHSGIPRLIEAAGPAMLTENFIARLGQDREFRAQWNTTVGQTVAQLWQASQAADRITQALTSLLQQTDARELVRQIERSVGNELQYIRVNGALVGGLAGLVLEFLRSLI